MELQLLPYISTKKLKEVTGIIEERRLRMYIIRQINTRKLYRLGIGIYVTDAYLDKLSDPKDYAYYLANVLHDESYISLTTALFIHQLTPKDSKFIYSIAQTPNHLKNKYGIFNYFSYPTRYEKIWYKGRKEFTTTRTFMLATRAKALFDFLYFHEITPKNFIETFDVFLRFSFDNLTRDDLDELAFYIEIFQTTSLSPILDLIKKRL